MLNQLLNQLIPENSARKSQPQVPVFSRHGQNVHLGMKAELLGPCQYVQSGGQDLRPTVIDFLPTFFQIFAFLFLKRKDAQNFFESQVSNSFVSCLRNRTLGFRWLKVWILVKLFQYMKIRNGN